MRVGGRGVLDSVTHPLYSTRRIYSYSTTGGPACSQFRNPEVIVVFTKVQLGAGAFSSFILFYFNDFKLDSPHFLDVQHLEHATDPLKNYTVAMVETSTFEQR